MYWYFTRRNANGTLDHLHNALREKVRIAEGRNAEPTAGIVDAQSIRGADTVGKNSRGYDAGEKINGRKRNIVVDAIHPAQYARVGQLRQQPVDGLIQGQETLADKRQRRRPVTGLVIDASRKRESRCTDEPPIDNDPRTSTCT